MFLSIGALFVYYSDTAKVFCGSSGVVQWIICVVCIFIRNWNLIKKLIICELSSLLRELSSHWCVYSYELTSDEHNFYAAIIASDCGNSY